MSKLIYRLFLLAAVLGSLSQTACPQAEPANKDRLKFVLILTRHGVRSPTWTNARLDEFSSQPWPKWPVDPGLLTPHGKRLMELFGAYDRMSFADAGLLTLNGCDDAARVYIYADIDERTRDSGRALADGMLPGCKLDVHTPADDKSNNLFHPHSAVTPAGAQSVLDSLAGHIGGDPKALLAAYRLPLEFMARTLATCSAISCASERKSLLQVAPSLSTGSGDHLVELKGPLSTGATFAENFQLEYLEGMPEAQVGWGQLNQNAIEELMAVHAASSDLVQRTPAVAAIQGGPLLRAVVRTLQQAEEQKEVQGAMGTSADKVVILVGHDTNISNVATLLDAHWLIDGYQRDDAAPGGALFFELWQRDGQADEIRVHYAVQTPGQMRQELPLSLLVRPAEARIYMKGEVSGAMSMSWTTFKATLSSYLVNARDQAPRGSDR